MLATAKPSHSSVLPELQTAQSSGHLCCLLVWPPAVWVIEVVCFQLQVLNHLPQHYQWWLHGATKDKKLIAITKMLTLYKIFLEGRACLETNLSFFIFCWPEVSAGLTSPQQYTPSPVGVGASLKLPSGPHLHAATVHQDAQTSSYTHQDRKGDAAQHSSDQQTTRQNSKQRMNNNASIQ